MANEPKISIASALVEITSDLLDDVAVHPFKKNSLIAECLEQVSQWHEMYCYDL